MSIKYIIDSIFIVSFRHFSFQMLIQESIQCMNPCKFKNSEITEETVLLQNGELPWKSSVCCPGDFKFHPSHKSNSDLKVRTLEFLLTCRNFVYLVMQK